MKIFIAEDEHYYPIIKYVLKLISINQNLPIKFCTDKAAAELIFDTNDPKSLPIACSAYPTFNQGGTKLAHQYFFDDKPIIQTDSGKIDYIATIFYMLNCLQEFPQDEHNYDSIQRFKYEASYQKKFGIIEENMVQQYINTFLLENGFSLQPAKKSRVFISHDIDTMYGSFLEDGFWALKKGRIDVILKLIFKEVLRSPDWRNIDQIIKLHSAYDIKSTFFWLVNNKTERNGIKNADYSIKRESKFLKKISEAGFVNGLHKSCSHFTLDEELQKLPVTSAYNRYHYLRFKLPEVWQALENSEIDFDSSLGFAEHPGFRNSYGLPFQPYNFNKQKEFNFIEQPLHVMDRSIHKYMKIKGEAVSKRIIAFLEKHCKNCILSILWHNNYFTYYKYDGFLDEYKKLLSFFYESQIQSITPEEIIQQWKITD